MKNIHFEGEHLVYRAQHRLVWRMGTRATGLALALLVLGPQHEVWAQAPAPATAQPQQRIRVSAVRIEGNTLLPEPALSQLTAGVAGTERSLPELNQVAARVQNAYRVAGYGGVVAYIPEQALTDEGAEARGRTVRERETTRSDSRGREA